MAKRRDRKKKRRKTKEFSSGLFLASIDNPFREVPQEELNKILAKAGQNYEKEFNESLAELIRNINEYHPLHLLSILSVYGLFQSMTKSGKIAKKEDINSISQAHVELIQALVLMTPSVELSFPPVPPYIVQNIWDLTISLSNAFSQKRLVQIQNTKSDQQKAILFLQEHVRLHTQMVRNWGYYKRVIQIIRELYSPLDSLYLGKIGLSATELIQTFEYLVMRMESSISGHRQRLRPVFKSRSVEEAIRAYYKSFPDLKDSPEKLIAHFQKQRIPLKGVFSFILSHSDLRIIDMFKFSIAELTSNTGIEQERLDKGLSELSLQFGDLKDKNPEHFFMDNPIWTKPLIKLTDGTYFCSIPQIFFSFSFNIMDGFLADNEDSQKACSDRRSQFLIEKISSLLEQSFPNTHCIKNFEWKDSDKQYETDLLMKVSSYLLIIEAKSGSITLPALRGAPMRIERHIKELIFEPAIQSQRFCKKILALKSGMNNDFSSLKNLPFDIKDIHKIIRLSVTLEDFATIQTNISGLIKTGWISNEFPKSPTIILSDFEIVLDTLESIPEKIHYFVRRDALEGKITFLGDELDLLGLYLETGLNLGATESGDKPLMISGMSVAIDDYYIAQDSDIIRKKPKLKLTKWWGDIINYIEQRTPDRWLEAAVMLLNVSPDEQRRVEKAFNKRIKKNVKSNWRQPGNINSIVIWPPEWRNEAVGLFAFRERQKDKRHDFMQNLSDNIFSKSHAERCLIIGVNIDRNEYPYSVLGVLERPVS